jgi:Ca2+-binding RTX toxin-like protein
MFFSFQKRRAAAPRIAKSRVRTSRRLLVEGLEERRVMAAGELIGPVHDFVDVDVNGNGDIDDEESHSSRYTTAEDVKFNFQFGTIDGHDDAQVKWYVFSDNACDFSNDVCGPVIPGNNQADLPMDVNGVVTGDDATDIRDTKILEQASVTVPTVAFDPGIASTAKTVSFTTSANTLYNSAHALPNFSGQFLAVVRVSVPGTSTDAEQYEWFRQAFSIDPDVGSLAVDSIDGPEIAIIGQPLEFTSGVSGTETAPEDLVHTWTVTNQQTSVVVSQGTSASLNYTPTTPGTYSISYSVNDGTIDASTAPVLLSVTPSSFVAGQLALGTAPGGSSVIVGKSGSATTVNVGGVTTNYTGVQGITIYGQAGNDVVIIGSNVTTPVTVFGGAGNDVITGGSGADILVGGAGTDAILGGSGRDLIIGGDGTDILIGSADDDIIIGGYTHHSAAQLAAILATWNGTGSFAARVNNLRASSLNQSTVFDDDDMDLLSGNAGSDWFFANLVSDNQANDRKDLILDRTANEFAQYLELINEVNP